MRQTQPSDPSSLGGLCLCLTCRARVPVSPEGLFGATTDLRESSATGGEQQLLWVRIHKHTQPAPMHIL